jgi:hypothetical protein
MCIQFLSLTLRGQAFDMAILDAKRLYTASSMRANLQAVPLIQRGA